MAAEVAYLISLTVLVLVLSTVVVVVSREAVARVELPVVALPPSVVAVVAATLPVVGIASLPVAMLERLLAIPLVALLLLLLLPVAEVARAHFQDLLVNLQEILRLVGKLKGEVLELAGLAAVDHNNPSHLVERGGEILVHNHFGDDAVDVSLAQLKQGRERVQAHGVVEVAVGEQVGLETSALDLAGEHGLDRLCLWHQVPNFDGLDGGDTLLPVTAHERLGGQHDVVTGVLGRAGEELLLSKVQDAPEGLANDPLPGVVVAASHVGHLQDHGAGEEDTLEELEVHVHVERNLAQLLKPLLLWGLLHPLLHHDTLGEELLVLASRVDVLERVLRLLEHAVPEGAESGLDHGAVKKDLG